MCKGQSDEQRVRKGMLFECWGGSLRKSRKELKFLDDLEAAEDAPN